MSASLVEANGAAIPLIGLGTWDLRGKSCARMVEEAIRLGYRHIDTAAMYGNEEEVGDGLRASLRRRPDERLVILPGDALTGARRAGHLKACLPARRPIYRLIRFLLFDLLIRGRRRRRGAPRSN